MRLGLYGIGLDGVRSADSYKCPNRQNNQRTSAVVWSWVPGDAKTGEDESGCREWTQTRGRVKTGGWQVEVDACVNLRIKSGNIFANTRRPGIDSFQASGMRF